MAKFTDANGVVIDLEGGSLKFNKFMFGFSLKTKIAVIKQIKKLLENNFNFTETINIMLQKKHKSPGTKFFGIVKDENSLNIKKDPEYYFLINSIEVIRMGKKISDCFDGWVSKEEKLLIASGEEVDLPAALGRAVALMEKNSQIKKTTRKASVQPLVFLSLIMGIFSFFAFKMVPILTNLLPVEDWPEMGKVFYSISMFIFNYWYFIFILLFGGGFVLAKTLPYWVGKSRDMFDGFFVWDIYRRITASTFIISLATLMQSGERLSVALKSIHDLSNNYQKRQVKVMLSNLNKMDDSGEILTKDVTFFRSISDDILIFSKAKDFAEAIEVVGEDAMEETLLMVEAKSSLYTSLLKLSVFLTACWILITFFGIVTVIQDQTGM